jgi:hypothetical protein
MMQGRAIHKDLRRSWIEVNNKTHAFVVGDDIHPEIEEIYAKLKRLIAKLNDEGYVPDTQLVLHNIDEAEKGLVVGSHSEKLTIAYGLMHMPVLKPIWILRNLRVCKECNIAIKLISKVTSCKIVAKDASQFHHFKDGLCSCVDYW